MYFDDSKKLYLIVKITEIPLFQELQFGIKGKCILGKICHKSLL